ncbi:MAG TPA: TetR family transcriptional regulator [Pseudonocardiaceae bacterium]|nr:TetR family transcriptional regulator [Pseudonocardiaceae bacterium]
MVRPRVPLLSRQQVLRTAMEIIDREGLEGLSIRRLAAVLGVNGTSLYHHFSSKEEIVAGAAELALAEARPATTPGGDWQEWLPEDARSLRKALLAHPALLPVMVHHRVSGPGARLLNSSAERMMAEGMPSAAVMPLLDALELFAIGSALHETYADATTPQPGVPAGEYPALAKAMSERGLSADEIYDLVTASILDAIDLAVKQRQARWLPTARQPDTRLASG